MISMHSPEEKALAPRIRFSGFTDAWEQRRLRDITERVTAACDDAKLPRVEYEDIDSGEGTLNKPIGNLGHSRAGVAFLRGDVLYGKLRPYLHNWLFPQFEGIALGDFWVLRPKAVDPSYLYRLVQSSAFDELANISAGSKMPRADWHLVGDANFALPPNSVEQRKIGALLSCLDDLIALHQRKCDGMKTVKKSLLEKMFPREGETTPELRCAGFTDAWEQRRLRDITERVTAACDDAKLPRVEYEDIDSGEGTLNKPIGNLGHSRAGVAFLRGDVLYGKLRPYLHNWLFPQFEGIALGDFWVLRPKAVDPSYLYRLVQSSAFDELANISAGSKMPRADWHLVGDANFALPPNSVEQRKIGALFSCLDDLIALHQRKLNVLKNVKKSLLEGMFV